jgi:hypothetical protein
MNETGGVTREWELGSVQIQIALFAGPIRSPQVAQKSCHLGLLVT